MAQPAFIKTTGGQMLRRIPAGNLRLNYSLSEDGGYEVVRNNLILRRMLQQRIEELTVRREVLSAFEVGSMLGWVNSSRADWKERLFGRRDLIVYIDGDHLRPVPFSCFSFRQLLDRLG